MADAQASIDAGTRRAVSTLEEYGGTADDAWARGSHENYDKDGKLRNTTKWVLYNWFIVDSQKIV